MAEPTYKDCLKSSGERGREQRRDIPFRIFFIIPSDIQDEICETQNVTRKTQYAICNTEYARRSTTDALRATSRICNA